MCVLIKSIFVLCHRFVHCYYFPFLRSIVFLTSRNTWLSIQKRRHKPSTRLRNSNHDILLQNPLKMRKRKSGEDLCIWFHFICSVEPYQMNALLCAFGTLQIFHTFIPPRFFEDDLLVRCLQGANEHIFWLCWQLCYVSSIKQPYWWGTFVLGNGQILFPSHLHCTSTLTHKLWRR